MKFGKCIAACCLVKLVFGFLSSALAGEFSKPNDTIGYASCFGDLRFTSHLGAVELSRGEIYDFYYQYSSWSEFDSPHLGKGFFVPVLESVLIDHDYFLESTTLGGSTIYMYRTPGSPDEYISLNGKNKAKKLGDDSYVRETADGFRLEYRLGKLVRVGTPGGTTLTFDYDGDFCNAVRSSTGSVVCSLTKLSETKGVFTTARGRHELEFQIHPATTDAEVQPVGVPPSHTLKSIGWPNEAKSLFEYIDLRDEGELKLRMSYEGQGMEFHWDKHTGNIISADDVRYDVSPLRREIDYEAERGETGTYSITRHFPDGTTERFFHDEDAGYSDVEKSSGEKIRTHFINTRGPFFNLVRKKERINYRDGEEKPDVFYEAFYDTKGDLLREVFDGKVTWHLRPEGGISENTVKDDDNFVRYDDKGRIVLSRFNDGTTQTKWMANGVSRVVSKYSWGEVYLRYFGPNGNPIPIPESEKFQERNSL